MGLDLNGVRFLVWAKKEGVPFDRVCMFGRLQLSVLPAKLKDFFESQERDRPVA